MSNYQNNLIKESGIEADAHQAFTGVKLVKKKDEKKMGIVTKKWTTEENDRYIALIKEFQSQIKTEKSRRDKKVFKKMSDLMNNERTPEQCRCHHKKMLERYGSLKQIIQQLPIRNNELIKNKSKKKSKSSLTNNQDGSTSKQTSPSIESSFEGEQIGDTFRNIKPFIFQEYIDDDYEKIWGSSSKLILEKQSQNEQDIFNVLSL